MLYITFFFQLADGHQAVDRISRKSTDRLGDDEIDLTVKGISNHLFEPFTALGVGARYTFVRIDLYKLPFRFGLYELGVIINLRLIAGELFIISVMRICIAKH